MVPKGSIYTANLQRRWPNATESPTHIYSYAYEIYIHTYSAIYREKKREISGFWKGKKERVGELAMGSLTSSNSFSTFI
jgi:hypothetical protein